MPSVARASQFAGAPSHKACVLTESLHPPLNFYCSPTALNLTFQKCFGPFIAKMDGEMLSGETEHWA